MKNIMVETTSAPTFKVLPYCSKMPVISKQSKTYIWFKGENMSNGETWTASSWLSSCDVSKDAGIILVPDNAANLVNVMGCNLLLKT